MAPRATEPPTKRRRRRKVARTESMSILITNMFLSLVSIIP